MNSTNRNSDSRQFNGVTRRNYLRVAGATGIGSLSLSATSGRGKAETARSNRLIVEGSGTRADYAFTVSGSVEPLQVNNHDTVRVSGAEGLVGGGDDRYAFSGDLVAVGLNGTATVRLNGEIIDPVSYPSVLAIEGAGMRADYIFTVGGSVEPLQVNSHDTVRDDGAEGLVGGGDDRYAINGDLRSFRLEGDATVSLNGAIIDPANYPDSILTIEGSGTRADYAFTVSGSVEPLQVNSHDTVRDDGAEGLVGGGDDRYAFSGDLVALGLNGIATVRLNGETIDPTTYPHILAIEGSGTRADYTFMVSESVDPLQVNSHDTVRDNGAEGLVGGGDDRYAINGDLVAVDIDGTATVRLDGGVIDSTTYPDSILTIEGSGTHTDYAFTVSGNVDPLQVNSHDTVRDDGAEGFVGGGDDRYAINGNFITFSLDGDADVYINDKRVDPDSLGDGSSTGLKLGYDARARSHRRGNTFDDFSDLNKAGGWYATNGDLSLDTDRKFHNNDPSSARLDGYSGDDRIGMAIDFPGGRAFSHRDLSLAVRLGEAAHETLRVELYAQTASDQFIATRYLSRKHGWVRVDLGASNIRGSPNLGNVRQFGIECYTGGKRVRMNIDAIRTTPKRDRGAAILTFDDADRTHYTNAFSEMRSRGIPGTCAIIPRVVGDSGNLTLDQMREMQNEGWTMASHPQATSVSGGLGSIPASEAEQMIRDTKRWLLNHGFDRGARCLIWPFGDFNHDAMELAGEYHELSFGGGSTPCGGRVTEAAWVPRVNTDDVGDSLDAIDYAARYNTVVTLMAHPVGTSRLPMNDFRRLLDRIESHNLDVLTASDFADEQ
jgi:peptidoglycan/xylan/chitin deacetylase (PgdA/CDA1 family)